jgi:hypothetical protein
MLGAARTWVHGPDLLGPSSVRVVGLLQGSRPGRRVAPGKCPGAHWVTSAVLAGLEAREPSDPSRRGLTIC